MTNSSRSQTRGFLFADLRGYSAFTEAQGDEAARELLARYRALVREQVAAFDGAEIRTEGDSFYVVFSSVADAVLAGLGIRDGAAAASLAAGVNPIRVGIGIHAGETRDGDEGIVSSAVNVAARVCSVAGAGEVLVSDTVRSLVRTSVDVGFTPRGRRRLKGIAEPIALFAAGGRGRLPAIGQPRRPFAVMIVGLAAVALAVGALAAFVQGETPEANQTSPHTTDTPRPTASSAPTTGATSEDAFPSLDEAELLDRLPSQVSNGCRRANPDDRPIYVDTALSAGDPISEVPLRISAGLSCLTELTRVVYWRARSASEIDAIFVQRISRARAEQGDCSLGSRAWQTWDAGAHAGKLYCYTNTAGEAVLEWTFGHEPVFAFATRRDGDTAALFAWWRDVGRLMSR